MLDTKRDITRQRADVDPLAPARGFAFALLMSAPFWLCIAAAVYLYFWKG